MTKQRGWYDVWGRLIVTQFEWYSHTWHGEPTWLGSNILGSWVLLLTLIGTGLTLSTCLFLAIELDDPH